MPRFPLNFTSQFRVVLLLAIGITARGHASGLPVGFKSPVRNLAAYELAGSEKLALTREQFLNGSVNFRSPEAWLYVEGLPPSRIIDGQLSRIRLNGHAARPEVNCRFSPHGNGTMVIPHGPSYPGLVVFSAPSFGGTSVPLVSHEKHDDTTTLKTIGPGIRSFKLKRGYMATLAENRDGTGHSRNYVAQDRDIEAVELPPVLDGKVRFIRVFPWRWTNKKGIAGNIGEGLNVSWYYDWNIGGRTSPDVEYVPIRQNRWWPGLDQDWKKKGSIHLLGFNEPDRPDQANMRVDDAIAAWPMLLKTGLRLGSPAVSDGGLAWLYEFMEKADARNLRVDFVAVHYYRATGNPGDGNATAGQLESFLREIHERTKRPIWLTEWNNGANWTNQRDPNPAEQARAIGAMIKMMDETPYVERYALYNWVEESRELKRKDNSLTPAGEVYRDQFSPPAFRQPAP